jgi:hypothetical protein
MSCWFHRWTEIAPTEAEAAIIDRQPFQVALADRDAVCTRCGATDPRFQRIIRGTLAMRGLPPDTEPGRLSVIDGGRTK